MRIGLTCATIEPGFTGGKIDGIGVHTKNLYQEFLKRNLSVTPVAFPKPKIGFRTSELPQGKMLPLPFNISTLLSMSAPMSRLLYKDLKKHIDILHVTDHLIPRVKNIPVVATMHDALMFSHPEWYSCSFSHIKNRFRKKSMHWANHYITVSKAMIPELVEFVGIKEKDISVVYNGISDFWFEKFGAEEKNKLLARFNLPEKFILHTGTIQPKKNAARLIEAYLHLPADLRHEYPLIIVGKIGWDIEEQMAAINKLIDQKAGLWLQYVTSDELRALYQAASLYLCPSLHEGFGYTLLEAFASEVPALVSNVTALPEIAGDAAWLVDPYSVNGMQEAMYRLLTSEALRQELVAKGKLRAQEFTLERCVQGTLKVYEKIAS